MFWLSISFDMNLLGCICDNLGFVREITTVSNIMFMFSPIQCIKSCVV